ncbi:MULTISPECIES: hypothetical protein [Halobacterium]|uniref:hypothetical protein n=1 Tax=Halobacterium TaxID=2239 RepID=UPI001966A7E1|nr:MULTISPECIES: hypothetical protein [Halobacterium]MCF2164800.1 hypothetical protein [Halobacterium salinarum]MCF2168575.1 hypothetical protein [Halobacterium salinarum]MCF2239246.1 hypothetical protein [Halobacterium salinarum]QRY22033.1 hypothetical protein JT689_08365 [Halobacterium sp. GSL-19]WJK63419.1 hypothetical protein QSJ49_09370 [Halobacterium salinarum]
MMSSNSRRYIEVGQYGVKFIVEQESIMGNETVPTPIDEIPLDELPISDIKIDGITRIEAVEKDDGQVLRMEFDEAEYQGETSDNGADKKSPGDFFERLENKTGITHDGGEFNFNSARSDKGNFIDFIDFLFEDGHISKDDLPYSTKYAHKAYLLNTEPIDQEGEQMKRSEQPVEGVYVPTYYGKQQKKEYMETLVNDFVKGQHID